MAILGYQIVIAAIIIGAAIMWGRKACIAAVVLASIWTLTHIFVPWLMILQFVTVTVAASIGLSIAPKPNAEPQLEDNPEPVQDPEPSATDTSGGWMILLIIGAVIVIAMMSQYNDTPVANKPVVKPPVRTRAVQQKAPESRTYSEKKEVVPLTPGKKNTRLVNRNPRQQIKSPGHNTIREVQQLLTSLGYNPGPTDGVFGAATRGAISQFQRDIGQYPDGYVSIALLKELRSRDLDSN